MQKKTFYHLLNYQFMLNVVISHLDYYNKFLISPQLLSLPPVGYSQHSSRNDPIKIINHSPAQNTCFGFPFNSKHNQSP